MNKQIVLTALLCFTQSSYAIDLLGAWRSAQAHNDRFIAAIHEREAGEEKLTQATSLYLPQVTLSGHYADNHYDTDYGDASLSSISQSGNSYGYLVTASLPLYDAEREANAELLAAQAALSKVSLRQAEQELLLRVARVYFDLVIAKERLDSVLAQKKAVEEQAKITKKSFDIGLVTINDYYEASATLDRVLSDEIIAKNALATQRNAFKKVTGLVAEHIPTLSDALTPTRLSGEELSYWQKGAETDNPAIVAQKYQVNIAQHEAEKYKLINSPTMALYAGHQIQWSGNGLSEAGGTDSTEYNTIGVHLSVPLYTGGNRTSRYREALARLWQQRALLNSSYKTVSHAAYQAFLAVNASVANYFALEQRVKSSKNLLDASLVSRKAGLRTTADVLHADQNYRAAQFELTSARYEYLFNKLKLAAIAGNLQEKDLVFINQLLTEAG